MLAIQSGTQWVIAIDNDKSGTYTTGDETPVVVLSLEKWDSSYTLYISNKPDTTVEASSVVFGDTIGFTTSADGVTTTELSPYNSFDAVIKFDTNSFASGTEFIIDFGNSNQKSFTKE
ncbi:hypothetical protein ThvES_00017760 [Thiovulum sp. ES]|nr:hypothetical protein ThvES_00017760 [Thiovulum sp. ES]